MAQFYDAAVIGGGPAGSTVATALARAGRSVIVFEKEKFPRFHVGESLLPFCLPIFEKLGLSEKIRAAGFQEKYGAFFWNETTGGTRPVVFEKSWDDRHPMAYQVKRADFDQLLLRHSEDSGAVVREETAIREVLFEEGRAVGVVARGRAGGNDEVRAKVVVDASGQTAFLSQKLGTRRFDTKLKRAAVFAHYEGAPRPAGRQAGDILLPTGEDVWYWIIPFSDNTASVGAVFEPAVTRGNEAETLEQRFERLIARNSRMPELLAGGRRISKVFGISDYSAASAKLRGDGYVLVGSVPRHGDRHAGRSRDRPRADKARPCGRGGFEDLRERSQPALRAFPALRLRLLRPGLLRGLLHRSPEPVHARRRHERPRRRCREDPVPRADLDEPDVPRDRFRPLAPAVSSLPTLAAGAVDLLEVRAPARLSSGDPD